MSNDMIPLDSSQVPAALAAAFGADGNDDLSAGVTAGFPVISYRGRVWRLKYKGEEHILRAPNGDAIASIEVVLLKANRNISKIYYAKSYVEGDDSAPDCWSVNGVTPDAGVQTPPSPTCAACPNNVWGSRITPAGKKTRACSDSRRVAVVPSSDLKNEAFGGPMLLRVPPASLADLSAYSDKLSHGNVPYNSLVTRVGFDPDASFPKLLFRPALNQDGTPKFLTAEQAVIVLDLLGGTEIERVLSAGETGGGEVAEAAQGDTSGVTPPAAAPAPAPVATPAPAPVAVAPVQTAQPAPVAAKPEPEPAATAPAMAAEPEPEPAAAEPATPAPVSAEAAPAAMEDQLSEMFSNV